MGTATTEIYTLSLHALFRSADDSAVGAGAGGRIDPVMDRRVFIAAAAVILAAPLAVMLAAPLAAETQQAGKARSEEHTSELQSQFHLVCRLLLEKKKKLHNI